MTDPRIDSLLDEAKRLRLSRRGILKRGAALGLSTAAMGSVLSSTGRATAARKAPAYIQERTLNTLQATYFVPAGQDFFCVEPVSNMTDAFNLAAAGETATGTRTLEPGESLTGRMRLVPRAL